MNIHDATEQAYRNGYEAGLAEREETVCQLRKKWQAAETLICTMCGHFDHRTDGNIVCGNRTCGEIVGYPVCGKFTPWIPVTERLPALHTDDYEEPDGSRMQFEVSEDQWVITAQGIQKKARYETDVVFQGWVGECGETVQEVTHWMPLQEPPREVK